MSDVFDKVLARGEPAQREFRCAGCSKPFGRGRALYVPTHELWFHEKCFKAASLPIGTQAFKRTPDAESLARFAEHDAALRARSVPFREGEVIIGWPNTEPTEYVVVSAGTRDLMVGGGVRIEPHVRVRPRRDVGAKPGWIPLRHVRRGSP